MTEDADFEAAKHSDPCTDESRKHGCTCTMEHSHSASIDPPEPIVDSACPLHGNAPDPDEAYERMRDDGGNPFDDGGNP